MPCGGLYCIAHCALTLIPTRAAMLELGPCAALAGRRRQRAVLVQDRTSPDIHPLLASAVSLHVSQAVAELASCAIADLLRVRARRRRKGIDRGNMLLLQVASLVVGISLLAPVESTPVRESESKFRNFNLLTDHSRNNLMLTIGFLPSTTAALCSCHACAA